MKIKKGGKEKPPIIFFSYWRRRHHLTPHQRHGLQKPPKLLLLDQQFSAPLQHCPKFDFNIIPNAVISKLTPDIFLLAFLIPIYIRAMYIIVSLQ